MKAAHEKASKRWGETTIIDDQGMKHKVSDLTDDMLRRGVSHSFTYAELGFDPFAKLDQSMFGFIPSAPKMLHKQNNGGKVGDALAAGYQGAKHTAGRLTRTVTEYTELLTDIPFRIAMYTDNVLRGKSGAEAAEAVREYLNDWGRLGKREKVYTKTAIPFYSWLQFSLERAFKDAVETPGMFMLPFKAADNVQSYMSDSPPPEYQPRWMNERLGIWDDPNENGYHRRIQGFAMNQEEALRQALAMGDLAEHMMSEATRLPIFGPGIEKVFRPRKKAPNEAPLRFLAQIDFVTKSAIEATYGRELFSGAPTGTRPELLMIESSRLEAGRGFKDLDKLGTGGSWLKDWLEFEVDEEHPERAKVNAKKRWLLGQTPPARFVSAYEQYVKNKEVGEANYLATAASLFGVKLYRYHPNEGRYYYDRGRLEALAGLMRQAHMIDAGVWVKGHEGPAFTEEQRALFDDIRRRTQEHVEQNPQEEIREIAEPDIPE